MADARYGPDFDGAPGRTRTCDPLLRRQPLYPAELPGRAREGIARTGTWRGEKPCATLVFHSNPWLSRDLVAGLNPCACRTRSHVTASRCLRPPKARTVPEEPGRGRTSMSASTSVRWKSAPRRSLDPSTLVPKKGSLDKRAESLQQLSTLNLDPWKQDFHLRGPDPALKLAVVSLDRI